MRVMTISRMTGLSAKAFIASVLLTLSFSHSGLGAGDDLLGTVDQTAAASSELNEQSRYAVWVLNRRDSQLYKKIFGLQEAGNWAEADMFIPQLTNQVLMGHVLFQRYMHPTAYKSSYGELRDWMVAYADHADARRIYRLAQKRRPSGAAAPKKPTPRKYRQDPDNIDIPAFKNQQRSGSQRRRVAQINRYCKSLLVRERPTQTLNYINRSNVRKDLTNLEFDQIRAWIAAQYFYERVPEKALNMAQEVISRNREAIPLADWTAGLAAWEMGQHEQAARHFEVLAKAQFVNRATRAAGAYWAARAFLVIKQPTKVSLFLEIAATAPFHFYGVLANRQLGKEKIYNWDQPRLTQIGSKRAMMNPPVARAVALVQIGHKDLAEAELRHAHGRLNPIYDRDIVALAGFLDLPAAQLQIAEYAAGNGFDAGLYPIPNYKPQEGFQVDRALLFAFMRKESKFDPNAKSWAGARGLMQLMPRTASSLANDRSLRTSNQERLFNPGFNLNLGQKYLRQLMSRGEPRGNLFMLAVAYNGGPGNLRKWVRELTSNTDPLFFIESIPAGETRDFIEGVLTNLWIYRHRLGQDTPSLDAAAAGKWPVYEALEYNGDRATNW